MFEVKAKLVSLGEIVSRESNVKTYQHQDCVVQTLDSQYPQKIGLKVVNKAIGKLTQQSIGLEFNFKFNIKGFDWKDKVITTLEVWYIEPNSQPSVQLPQAYVAPQPATNYSAPITHGDNPVDDLPF